VGPPERFLAGPTRFCLQERFAFASVGGDGSGHAVSFHEVEVGEVFAEFSCFSVAHPDEVSDGERVGGRSE